MNYELKLEVCCADLQSVRAAVEGGAHRVELCQALGLDGLTPSAGMIEQAVSMGIHVQVLIRPREGDFVYDRDEVLCMQRDIRHARELGAGGVVIGALRPDGSIDEETTRRLVDEAEGMSITFHRAFDVCARPEEALEQLRGLVEQADGRIIIMPGAGVNPQNASRILSETGAHEIHGSLRSGGHTDAALVRALLDSCRQ